MIEQQSTPDAPSDQAQAGGWGLLATAKAAAALVTLSALMACGNGNGGTPVSEPPANNRPAMQERSLSPVTVDPAVDTATEVHVAINPTPSLPAAGKLFVMLPGTEGVPNLYRQVLRSGAVRGYHTLGLNYPNPTAVGALCTNSSDANCYWDVRREIITGTNYSALVNVSTANAIVTRLTKALAYLHQTSPDEGWGQFLSNGAIDWQKVTMAGHSQGGGHAGVMAKLFAMDRTVYFASPADWSAALGGPAAWMSATNVTAANKQFGFSHLQDPLVPYAEVSVNWSRLGLTALGSPTTVDGNSAPYGNTHILTTTATPNQGAAASPFHGAPVLDSVTPLTTSGTPLFDPVWAYLCFPS